MHNLELALLELDQVGPRELRLPVVAARVVLLRAVALGALVARDIANQIADLRLLVVGEEVGHLASV